MVKQIVILVLGGLLLFFIGVNFGFRLRNVEHEVNINSERIKNMEDRLNRHETGFKITKHMFDKDRERLKKLEKGAK